MYSFTEISRGWLRYYGSHLRVQAYRLKSMSFLLQQLTISPTVNRRNRVRTLNANAGGLSIGLSTSVRCLSSYPSNRLGFVQTDGLSDGLSEIINMPKRSQSPPV